MLIVPLRFLIYIAVFASAAVTRIQRAQLAHATRRQERLRLFRATDVRYEKVRRRFFHAPASFRLSRCKRAAVCLATQQNTKDDDAVPMQALAPLLRRRQQEPRGSGMAAKYG